MGAGGHYACLYLSGCGEKGSAGACLPARKLCMPVHTGEACQVSALLLCRGACAIAYVDIFEAGSAACHSTTVAIGSCNSSHSPCRNRGSANGLLMIPVQWFVCMHSCGWCMFVNPAYMMLPSSNCTF